MIKGFINYNNKNIPFVINTFTVELFSNDCVLNDFRKEYRFKTDFVLKGEYSESGVHKGIVTFFVNYCIADSLYLHCYILNILYDDNDIDTIGFESPFLDDIFKYKYNYLDMIRNGVNLGIQQKEVYSIPLKMNSHEYTASYCIGHNHRMGLLEDFEKHGELLLNLNERTIQEYYSLSVVINRLATFMTSYSKTSFKRITLYKKGMKRGWLYTPIVLENSFSGYDVVFNNFEVMNYIPKILNNIALDTGNQIEKSIPLGHIKDDNSTFSPQRFIEQVMAFEYLYDKIDHQKAQNNRFTLKDELKEQFDNYSNLLSDVRFSSDNASEKIKEIRRRITHGYKYWYDFSTDQKIQLLMILLDKLIAKMSLNYIGFTDLEIKIYHQEIVL